MYTYSVMLPAILFFTPSLWSVTATSPPSITPAPAVDGLIAKRQTAQAPILSTMSYAYSSLPYQVYPYQVLRGPQYGYNQCNATTFGNNSNCQTLIFNGPDDFCLWGSPTPNEQIGTVEARVVAYCTKPNHGSRPIPPGSITGLQFTRTSAYIQVTGFIKNAALGLDNSTGNGGELDPHGADLQGNPLGGVVFSNGTKDSDGHTPTQVFNWNNFVGNNQFCFKACFNSVTSPNYCENRYDLIGCEYNMPSAVKDGEFTECDGDLQDVVGIYTTNGAVATWSMPDPLVSRPPYNPRIPSSSNCKTHQSTDLLLGLPTSSGSSTVAKSTGTPPGITGGSSAGSAVLPAKTGVKTSAASHSSTMEGSLFYYMILVATFGAQWI